MRPAAGNHSTFWCQARPLELVFKPFCSAVTSRNAVQIKGLLRKKPVLFLPPLKRRNKDVEKAEGSVQNTPFHMSDLHGSKTTHHSVKTPNIPKSAQNSVLLANVRSRPVEDTTRTRRRFGTSYCLRTSLGVCVLQQGRCPVHLELGWMHGTYSHIECIGTLKNYAALSVYEYTMSRLNSAIGLQYLQ